MKFAITFLTLLILSAVAAAQSPAEIRAREIAALITSGDRAAVRKYVESSFGERMRGMPMERHLGFFSTEHDYSRGLEISGVQESGPNEVTLLVKNKLTGEWQGMWVAVEPAPPHKVAAIGRKPAKPPTGETKKLDDKDIARELDEFAKKLTGVDVFSGTILLARNGEVVYKGAFGIANKDFSVPNRIDTKFNLGS